MAEVVLDFQDVFRFAVHLGAGGMTQAVHMPAVIPDVRLGAQFAQLVTDDLAGLQAQHARPELGRHFHPGLQGLFSTAAEGHVLALLAFASYRQVWVLPAEVDVRAHDEDDVIDLGSD